MAKTRSYPDAEAAVALLPQNGSEIPYEQWRNLCQQSGNPRTLRGIQTARRVKMAEFRLDGEGGHFVKLVIETASPAAAAAPAVPPLAKAPGNAQ